VIGVDHLTELKFEDIILSAAELGEESCLADIHYHGYFEDLE
jgi:hypothetical protein